MLSLNEIDLRNLNPYEYFSFDNVERLNRKDLYTFKFHPCDTDLKRKVRNLFRGNLSPYTHKNFEALSFEIIDNVNKTINEIISISKGWLYLI